MKWKVGRSDEVWEHEAAADSPNLQRANSGSYDPKNSLYESLAGKKKQQHRRRSESVGSPIVLLKKLNWSLCGNLLDAEVQSAYGVLFRIDYA